MTERISIIRRKPIERRIDPPAAQDESELAEFWLALRRQFWLVTLCALAGLMLGAFHYVTSPKEYYAGASVLIEERQNDLEQEISTALPLLRNETGVQNEMQILGSLHLAEEVIRKLDLQANEDFLYPKSSLLGRLKSRAIGWVRSLVPNEPVIATGPAPTPEEIKERRILDAASMLRARTAFTRVGRSFAVEIGYTSHEPALAVAIANAYADAYLADGMQANLETSERKAAWMRDRIEELRQAALEAASEAERFRAEHGAMDQQGLLERDQNAAASNEILLSFQSRYQQIALEGSFPVTNGRILSRAITPKQPAKPKAWQLLGAGLVVGMMLGLALATLRERGETGFRTGEDVRAAAGLAFLGYLPTFKPSDPRPRKRAERVAHAEAEEVSFASARHARAGGADVPFTVAGPRPMPAATKVRAPRSAVPAELNMSMPAPGSAADAALRNVLAAVDLDFDDKAGRVVAIGAVMPGEGATTVAANLANLAALSGRRTLLIDSDFARSDLTHRLGADDEPGALGVIDGSIALSDAMRWLPDSGLDFLPTGATARRDDTLDPRNLTKLEALISSVKSSYDYVFIDLPPMGLRPEAKTLARSLDRVILVTRWGETSRRLVRSYLDFEPEIRQRTLGAVLNRTDLKRLPRYGVPLGHRGAFSSVPSA